MLAPLRNSQTYLCSHAHIYAIWIFMMERFGSDHVGVHVSSQHYTHLGFTAGLSQTMRGLKWTTLLSLQKDYV